MRASTTTLRGEKKLSKLPHVMQGGPERRDSIESIRQRGKFPEKRYSRAEGCEVYTECQQAHQEERKKLTGKTVRNSTRDVAKE